MIQIKKEPATLFIGQQALRFKRLAPCSKSFSVVQHLLGIPFYIWDSTAET